MFKSLEKWCIQINRSYANTHEYHVGNKKKICQMYEDMQRKPNVFCETMKIKDNLSEVPSLTIEGGRFGFVPGKNVPITAVVTYKTSGRTKTNHNSGGFKGLKMLLSFILLLLITWVGITITSAIHMERGLQTIENISKECYVTTEKGKPRTINVFGETLWYDTYGKIIIPNQREITQYDTRRFERPFQYCSIVSIDGIEPIIN